MRLALTRTKKAFEADSNFNQDKNKKREKRSVNPLN